MVGTTRCGKSVAINVVCYTNASMELLGDGVECGAAN